jgi:hypothetical protein
MIKIFISHSSKADPFADQVREAVAEGLRGSGYDVLIDRDALQPGDEWSSVLYHWLAECHGAVVLLNRPALESTWVRREVNILLWRRALGFPLKLVPAIIGDLTVEDVGAAGFDELEPFQFAQIAPQAPKDADELAAQIVDRFAGLPASAPDQSPMGAWVKAIASGLREVKDMDSLEAAARQLQVEERYLSRVRDPAEGCFFLAHQLLARARDDRVRHAMAQIVDYIPTEWLQRLIVKVAPTWVDGESARMLLALHDRRPRTAILNARSPRTAEQYVGRASCCAVEGYVYQTVSAVAGENFIDEFEENCRKAVRALLRIPPEWELEEGLPSSGEEPEDVTFLIVQPASARMALVAEGVRRVQALFPWLTVVLLTRDTWPTQADLTAWQLTGALVLSPPLEAGEEMQAQKMIEKLDALLPRYVSSELATGAE